MGKMWSWVSSAYCIILKIILNQNNWKWRENLSSHQENSATKCIKHNKINKDPYFGRKAIYRDDMKTTFGHRGKSVEKKISVVVRDRQVGEGGRSFGMKETGWSASTTEDLLCCMPGRPTFHFTFRTHSKHLPLHQFPQRRRKKRKLADSALLDSNS